MYDPLAVNGILSDIPAEVGYIAVLGSGHVSDPRLPANSQIGGASLYRIVEGGRLADLLPDSRVVITGGIGYDPVPNAEVVRKVALMIGIEGDRLIIEDRPRDTIEEAEHLKGIVGSDPFILVTSANHMKRAVPVCAQPFTQPLPAMPRPANFELARNAVYEYLGTIWMRIKELLKNFQ